MYICSSKNFHPFRFCLFGLNLKPKATKLSFRSLIVQQFCLSTMAFCSIHILYHDDLWVNGYHFQWCYFSSMLWVLIVGIYFQCYEYEFGVQDWGARKGGICVGTWKGFNRPQQSIRQAFQEMFLSYIVNVCIISHFCLCISCLLVTSNSLSQPWVLGFLFKLHFAYRSWSNLSMLRLGFQ
jgi:hypothetical protein